MDTTELEAIWAGFEAELSATEHTLQTLEALRIRYLGAKSPLRLALRSIKNHPPETQKEFASAVNTLSSRMESTWDQAHATLKKKLMAEQITKEWLDLTLPGTERPIGMIHPIHMMARASLNALMALGFEQAEGRDTETAYYNFDALNIPAHHPARDMQDTFWLSEEWLLRTHTTSVQSRILSQRCAPPIKKVAIGRVYRNEAVDATHLAMFHQLDGFWVEKGLNLCHLKGVVTFLVKQLYGDDQRIRFKPKYYPYTEPSLGVDIECSVCHGQGCSACHDTGWVTVMGAGMIHQTVLKEFGYNPAWVSGIAFGWGLSRLTSQYFKCTKLRPLYIGDLRVLSSINHAHSSG